jgi:HAD superfamily hydrolase (TIGR01509 family)
MILVEDLPLTLKAVLFDFNGVIINDESLHQQLLEEILLQENLRFAAQEFDQVCLGRSDRACLTALLESRGRVATPAYLQKLLHQKSQAYQQRLATMEKLPIYPGVADLVYKCRVAKLHLGVVSGAMRREVETVLERIELRSVFTVIVAGDDILASKPDPAGYLLAAEQLRRLDPDLGPQNCLAIEDTLVGMAAAKAAGMQVVGVANTYPYHFVQRHSNWAVDYLWEVELERIQAAYSIRS